MLPLTSCRKLNHQLVTLGTKTNCESCHGNIIDEERSKVGNSDACSIDNKSPGSGTC